MNIPCYWSCAEGPPRRGAKVAARCAWCSVRTRKMNECPAAAPGRGRGAVPGRGCGPARIEGHSARDPSARAAPGLLAGTMPTTTGAGTACMATPHAAVVALLRARAREAARAQARPWQLSPRARSPVPTRHWHRSCCSDKARGCSRRACRGCALGSENGSLGHNCSPLTPKRVDHPDFRF